MTALSAIEISHLVNRREISPTEVIEAHLSRAEEQQPRLNAFIALDPDGARKSARQLEVQLSHNGSGLPLAGVPISIKGSIDAAGFLADAGTRLRKAYIARQDAPLVERLKRAGAIVIGTTNTPELLMSYETDNALHGRTANPFDLSRSAGGSSGGEAAAIASGCVAGGVGSDGGGSIRVPAHFCGICGLKPTPGRIPATGHYPPCLGPFAQLGVVGPMARTIADLRTMFDLMKGPDIGDPGSTPIAEPHRDELKPELKRLVVGLVLDGRATAETEAAVGRAARVLEDAGVAVEPIELPEAQRIEELWFNIFCRGSRLLLEEMFEGNEPAISPMLRAFMKFLAQHPRLTGEALMNTLLERDQHRIWIADLMKRHSVLLTPVSTAPAFRHGEGGWGTEYPANYLETMRYCQWFNLLGNPGVVVPVANSSEGLPIGVQIAGRPYEEHTILDVAAEIERSLLGSVQAPAV